MSESQLQSAIICALRFAFPQCFLFAVPNGGSRHRLEAANLKRQGVKAGVADLCVLLPNGRVGFIEVKVPKGRISDAQREFAETCRAYSIPHTYARSIDDAITAVRAWSAT